MGIAKQFNSIIESQLNIFAAWLPLANTFKLGDYGIIADGVFSKMGNIQEFGIDFTPADGKEASIDFTSDSTQVINFAAGAQVDVIPAGAIDAKVTFKFDKEKSFMVKSPSINITAIDNINEAGNKLMNHPDWNNKFKVVYQLYFAKEAVVLSTINANTEITFSGDATALKQLNVGNASVSFATTQKLGLDLQGKEGTIGLGLFQIVRKIPIIGPKTVAILGDDEIDSTLEILSAGDAEDDV